MLATEKDGQEVNDSLADMQMALLLHGNSQVGPIGLVCKCHVHIWLLFMYSHSILVGMLMCHGSWHDQCMFMAESWHGDRPSLRQMTCMTCVHKCRHLTAAALQ